MRSEKPSTIYSLPRPVNDVRILQAHPKCAVVGTVHGRQLRGHVTTLVPARLDENLRPHGTRQRFRAAEDLESIPALCGCHRIEALQDRLNLPGTGGRPIEARERGRV